MGFYQPQFEFSLRSINTMYRRQLLPNETFKGELHDFWELIYIEAGELTVAEDDRVYEIKEGQIVFHKPMEFHRFWRARGKETSVIIISFDCRDAMIQQLGDGVFELDTILRQELIHITDNIKKHFNVTSMGINQKADSAPLQEMLTYLDFQSFLLHILEHANNRQDQSYNASAINYRKIVCTLNEHIYEDLSVEEIASLCCLGVSNLKKTFSMYAGCGVMHYFNNLKILKAKELLTQDLSIAQISERLSFSSPNYFSLVFKKHTGKLPTQFRRNTKI